MIWPLLSNANIYIEELHGQLLGLRIVYISTRFAIAHLKFYDWEIFEFFYFCIILMLKVKILSDMFLS